MSDFLTSLATRAMDPTTLEVVPRLPTRFEQSQLLSAKPDADSGLEESVLENANPQTEAASTETGSLSSATVPPPLQDANSNGQPITRQPNAPDVPDVPEETDPQYAQLAQSEETRPNVEPLAKRVPSEVIPLVGSVPRHTISENEQHGVPRNMPESQRLEEPPRFPAPNGTTKSPGDAEDPLTTSEAPGSPLAMPQIQVQMSGEPLPTILDVASTGKIQEPERDTNSLSPIEIVANRSTSKQANTAPQEGRLHPAPLEMPDPDQPEALTPTIPISRSREQAKPTVKVTIGRVEIRAAEPQRTPQPQLPPAPRQRWHPQMSLDDYLDQRHRRAT